MIHNNIKINLHHRIEYSINTKQSSKMYANVTKHYGCLDCGYFTNIKGNILKHNLTKKHIDKTQPKKITQECKYQCKKCLKKYKSQSSLWYHKQKCNPIDKSMKNEINQLQGQMSSLTTLMQEMIKNQQSTYVITNNLTNNYTTNINLFLDEKCKHAIGMQEFIQGIQFSSENITCSNLLKENALQHTVDIFQKHLDKLTIYNRPLHNFINEDKNQLIAHYRVNNEWKTQSELNMVNEIHSTEENLRDTTLISYLQMFHKRRLQFFHSNSLHSNRHLLSNLNYTTYPEQQVNLLKNILKLTCIDIVE